MTLNPSDEKDIFLDIFAEEQTFDDNLPLLEILLSPFKSAFSVRGSFWLHPFI